MAKATHGALVVFTEVTAEAIIGQGGSGDWVLNPEKASNQKYIVCCRKSRWHNKTDGVPNGAAFLVGVIENLIPGDAVNKRGQHRYFVKIAKFATVKVENVWDSWRNPVIYRSLEELGIDPRLLKFKPAAAVASEAVSSATAPDPTRLTIAEAKKALAMTFGVDPDDIEITVRG